MHKLLLADDSVTIQRVVELTFSGEDVQVVTVGDGEQAIARIPAELPDIVLADIGMPKRSGYDVSAFVKGRSDLAHIPVLLLAGAFEPVDEQRAQQVQSDGVLVKPFEPQQVIARVRELIRGHKSGVPSPAAVAHAARPDAVRPHPDGALRSEPADWSHAPAVETLPLRAAGPTTGGGETSGGDYFDRLDAAFAQLEIDPVRPAPAHPATEDEDRAHGVPTVSKLLSETSLPTSLAPEPPPAEAPRPEPQPASDRNLVADMFAALFAMEQGESVTPVPRQAAPGEAPMVTDALVDEVTRRVLARLAPDAANALVTHIVSEVAERLIRDEIARIKSSVGSKL
ncbi:MAG TPA: response regulator [Vicinamibacterales bacterium]|nr:response regulator [Vicinamibacterales bacterium]